METLWRGCLGLSLLLPIHYIRFSGGYIGIMEKNMETTI